MEEAIEDVQLVREGTILITRRNPATDIFMDKIIKFVHLSIVAVEDGEKMVYDLHPDNKNNENGNLEKRRFRDYMKGKELIGLYHTGASTNRIQSVAKKCWKGKYKTWYFNCQQFIDDITYKEIRSDFYSYYTVLIIFLAVCGVALIGGTIYVLAGGAGKSKK